MTSKIEELIQPGAVLAFDTNALWSHRKLFRVCDLANRLDWDPPLRLVVPAVAHGEHVLHIRHEILAKGRTFDVQALRLGLERKGLEIESFGREDAERVAELIADRYEDANSWRAAKRELAIRRLGSGAASALAARRIQFAATVDWLIAGQCAGNEWVLVSDDDGPELSGVRQRIGFAALERLLEDRLAARG